MMCSVHPKIATIAGGLLENQTRFKAFFIKALEMTTQEAGKPTDS